MISPRIEQEPAFLLRAGVEQGAGLKLRRKLASVPGVFPSLVIVSVERVRGWLLGWAGNHVEKGLGANMGAAFWPDRT